MSDNDATSRWLMKAEPDPRIVKGKDVKFSVDDFESVSTTSWEGVRNAEARNLMKEMKVGDKVLFYHSNCKNPGIAAFAEVVKEAYPDYTAWDASHPYFDAKTDKEKPKWYMVDVKFQRRATHFVSLSLLKSIASGSVDDVDYLDADDVASIKGMALINRGRLSVQRVEEEVWVAVEKLAEKGGWQEGAKPTKKPRKVGGGSKKSSRQEEVPNDDADEDSSVEDKPKLKTRKRKVEDTVESATEKPPKRQSTRSKTTS